CNSQYTWSAPRRFLPPFTENPFSLFRLDRLKEIDGQLAARTSAGRATGDLSLPTAGGRRGIGHRRAKPPAVERDEFLKNHAAAQRMFAPGQRATATGRRWRRRAGRTPRPFHGSCQFSCPIRRPAGTVIG